MNGKRDFVLASTRLIAPPLTPEIWLRLADEAVPIWKKTEDELGAMGPPPPFWAFAWAGGQALARYALDHTELIRGEWVLISPPVRAGCDRGGQGRRGRGRGLRHRRLRHCRDRGQFRRDGVAVAPHLEPG